jgi:preprotein translocase subunit SecG
MLLTTLDYVFGTCLLVMAVFLVIAVLMQNGKSHNLSGTIAGGAETFFGKAKGRTIDALLSKITTVVSILFVIVVLLVYIFVGGTAGTKDADDTNADSNTTGDTTDEENSESEKTDDQTNDTADNKDK